MIAGHTGAASARERDLSPSLVEHRVASIEEPTASGALTSRSPGRHPDAALVTRPTWRASDPHSHQPEGNLPAPQGIEPAGAGNTPGAIGRVPWGIDQSDQPLGRVSPEVPVINAQWV
jgi:hypothetical protein